MQHQYKKLPSIVIVGGGAGGLELATKLGKTLGKQEKAGITLIDATLTHLWKPLLHEVAAGTLNSYEDELSYLALAKNNHFTFRLGRVDKLNREQREITTAPTLDKHGQVYIPRRTFAYDILVFAVGSQTNDFNVKGVQEHCMFLDTRADADAFHQHFLRSVYAAHAQTKPMRAGQLKIAIAGAGATGIELSAELHEAVRQLVSFGLDGIREDEVKISIVEAAERILPALPARLSEKTVHALKKIDIALLTDCKIIEARTDGFVTDKGDLIPAEIKIWAAGIKAPNFLKGIDGLETNTINQLVVDAHLQTTFDKNIFALGDCAACLMTASGSIVPPRAQAAHQQAITLVKIIKNKLNNKPIPVYQYTDYGSLINLSRYSTVGSLMGNLFGKKAGRLMIEGLLARFIYISLYKMHQLAIIGFIRVMLTTIANLLTQKTKPRMKLH